MYQRFKAISVTFLLRGLQNKITNKRRKNMANGQYVRVFEPMDNKISCGGFSVFGGGA